MNNHFHFVPESRPRLFNGNAVDSPATVLELIPSWPDLVFLCVFVPTKRQRSNPSVPARLGLILCCYYDIDRDLQIK